MSDLVTIGFRANTGDLKQAQVELDKTAKAGDRVDKSGKAVQQSLGGVGRRAGQAGIQIQQETPPRAWGRR